jgi:hypothetical protein
MFFLIYVTESHLAKLKYCTITMFCTMKLAILFVAASLMLVGALVAIAVPSPVQAAFSYCINGVLPCFDNKGDCQKELRNIVTKAKCERQKPL